MLLLDVCHGLMAPPTGAIRTPEPTRSLLSGEPWQRYGSNKTTSECKTLAAASMGHRVSVSVVNNGQKRQELPLAEEEQYIQLMNVVVHQRHECGSYWKKARGNGRSFKFPDMGKEAVGI